MSPSDAQGRRVLLTAREIVTRRLSEYTTWLGLAFLAVLVLDEAAVLALPGLLSALLTVAAGAGLLAPDSALTTDTVRDARDPEDPETPVPVLEQRVTPGDRRGGLEGYSGELEKGGGGS